ncbi:AbrB family transcriptional regulator [Enterovirga aerilata]|uniref:AbrB family transcriptional regulator n=1 Tax=Enterovirga aerilata TaxID=2730920 RepID=A0A849I516_9HYPH|nr:AbrB family transcriptional regulator [Enterovirga sp. DB1703]NNM74936.1 AbrB family transcriptional regulator [Enterovirga sp. DB1703]
MRPGAEWAGLVAASFGLSWLFEAARLPAAMLLGPMVAGIAFGAAGARIRMPRPAFTAAQSIVGCLIAHSITGAIVASVVRDWPAMLLVVTTTIFFGGVVGWLLGRFGTLPGAVAAWGSSPGGASAMVAMADAAGADPRLVAIMQYVRVVCVVAVASVVARLMLPAAPASGMQAAAYPSGLLDDAGQVAATLAVAVAGAALGRWLRLPAGAILGPMMLGAVLHATGLVEMTIPAPLLTLAYAAIGWFVGLRFTKATLAVAWRALPEIIGGSLVLIALGAVSAWLLIQVRHTDPLTAFLATTPGGIDSVAIIAIGSDVDVGFVMALQAIRVLLVVLTGAPLARLIIRATGKR